MNILGYDLILKKRSNQRRKNAQFATAIRRYEKERYSQDYPSYNTIHGSRSITMDIIKGLYDSTILNRIVNKMASDAIPRFYSVQVVDMEEKRIKEAELLCKQLHSRLSRREIRQIFVDTLLFGSTLTYKKMGENGFLESLWNFPIDQVEPVISKDGELEAWIDKRGDTEQEIPMSDLMYFTWDQSSGDVFGKGILGPIISVLHLFLNTQLNLSEIVDKFVIPILAWVVSTDEDEITSEKIDKVVADLTAQYEQGSDLVFTDDIRSEIVGAAQHSFDLVPILKDLKESVGIATIPMQILGGKADNLSSSRIQLKTYLDSINDYQSMITDVLVSQLYRPFLEEQGYTLSEDYLAIYIVFPPASSENMADSIKWLLPYLNQGIITRNEARAIANLSGVSLALDEIELYDPSKLEQSIKDNEDKDGRKPEDEK